MLKSRPDGIFEIHSFPDKLEAHVVSPGPNPTIHGYSVEDDIVKHYDFIELMLLSLTGEIPTTSQTTAFDIALQFIAPISAREAPVHSAILANVCGARSSAIISISAITLAERARHIVSQYMSNGFETTDEDRESVKRLKEVLSDSGITIPELYSEPDTCCDPDRWSALFAVLKFAGITDPNKLEMVIVIASMAVTFAEAKSHKPVSLREYPANLPPFVYKEEDNG